ncbi:MAG: Aldehyde Dehydrogenase [Frankiales bacterium]|nr:Aldehyde Dehydrogenase [Frankiales bacterium]
MSELVTEPRMLIDGKLAPALSGRSFANVNPATEEVLGTVADGSAEDMDAAIDAARTAFDRSGWADDLDLRIRCLRQLEEALTKHADEFRATVVAEVGCPVSLTRMAQYDTPVKGIGWVADLAGSYAWESSLGQSEAFGIRTERTLRREPAGVVGAITPWNFPVQINLAKVAPALAAGCTVVLKPAPDTPYSATLLGRVAAEETELPPGVLNVVTSAGHEVGQQLSEDPRVDLISFTGSTATGRRVVQASAGNLKKVFLELGGKSAHIVLDDADLSAAAFAAAFQIMVHSGQGCAITTRLLLPRSRYDEGVDALVEMMRSIPYGDPTDPATLGGPLIREQQRQRVLSYIRTGVEEGARIALGGGVPAHLPKGFYVEPTVLVEVDNASTVAQEEIFGPVLVVIAHDGDDDAVRIANDSAYGLSGAITSSDTERAMAVARRIRTGTIAVNGGVYYGPDVPFGGYKHSGVGRESGVLGFEEYLEAKVIAGAC